MMTRFLSLFSVLGVISILASGFVYAQEAPLGAPVEVLVPETVQATSEPQKPKPEVQAANVQEDRQQEQEQVPSVKVYDVKSVIQPGVEPTYQVTEKVVPVDAPKAQTPTEQTLQVSQVPSNVVITPAQQIAPEQQNQQAPQQDKQQQVQTKPVEHSATQAVAVQPAAQEPTPAVPPHQQHNQSHQQLNQQTNPQPADQTQQAVSQTTTQPVVAQPEPSQSGQLPAAQIQQVQPAQQPPVQQVQQQPVYPPNQSQPNGQPMPPNGQGWYTGQGYPQTYAGQPPPMGFYLMQPDDIAQAPSVQKAIQASVKALKPEPAPEQKTPPLPTCHVETDVSVWVFGGTKQQGQLLCFNAGTKELEYAPVFMTKVFAHSGGFDPNAGLYDQIFLYDMTQLNKNGKRAKPKRRLFDYEEMEFQRMNFLPWCNQVIDIAPGKEYVVFVKTPATNYWFDLASRAINTGTTLGSLLAGYFIVR